MFIDTSCDTLSKLKEQINDVTKYVNILHLTWESSTLLWPFKLLMRASETRNSSGGGGGGGGRGGGEGGGRGGGLTYIICPVQVCAAVKTPFFDLTRA